MKRLFAAIKLHPGEDFLRHYYSLRNKLKSEKIKWVETENIHITLKFFGETPVHHIPAIKLALDEAAHKSQPFILNIRNTGIFGSAYRPRVIWLGLGEDEKIKALAEHVFNELEQAGIMRDRQNFVPHLTIGRIKSLGDKRQFQQVIDQHREVYIQKEEVKNFHLFESVLKPGGPEYSIINSFELQG